MIKETKQDWVSFRMGKKLKIYIKAQARKESRSMAGLIDQMIFEYRDRRKKKKKSSKKA